MASNHRANFHTNPVANPEAVVGGKDKGVKYRFTVLTDGLIRYEYAHDGEFEDRASTFSIHRNQPVPKFRVVETDDDVIDIVTDRFRLTYDKKPFSTNGLKIDVLGNLSDWHSTWRFGEEIGDLGGTARTLDEANGRIPLMPGILSRNGFAGIDDSTSMLFEKDGWVGARKAGERVDGYIFAYGIDYREALKAFYAVSGKPPLLPRWALGNWWSRYYAYADKEYLDLMDRFKDEGVPLSVGVIDMDWHEVDIDPKHGSGWTGYSWNKKLFPDPKKFTSELRKRDLKITLNVHPADGVRSYEDAYKKVAKQIGHDTQHGDPVAFDVTDRKFMDAYFDILHREVEDDGVDFWWVDWQQGPFSKIPGIDPLWVLNHYHFLDNARDGTRALTFSRYAGPGSHRYPVGFSGDTIVTWESLDFQPEFTATASNIGYNWWSHDIGGHMNGYKNDELATRWVQLGCFSPILRLHSSNNPFNSKAPWTFGPEACKAQIDILRFRHRLIPYLYTMNYLSATNGIPLVQPMYYDYPTYGSWPGDAYSVPNQFQFGSSLLVVPITSLIDPITKLSQSKGWLPPGGRFVDIFSSVVYDGDRHVKFHRGLGGYPVLAKEGSIIPLDASTTPPNGCGNPTKIELLVVVGADGHFELLEDDGSGSDIHDVKTIKTPITFSQETGVLTIGSASGDDENIREWVIHFLSYRAEATPTITIDGKDATSQSTSLIINKVDHLMTTTSHPSQTTKISLNTPNPQLTPTSIRSQIFPILDKAQILFGTKSKIWDAINAKANKTVILTKLLTIDMPESLRDAVMEFALADVRSD